MEARQVVHRLLRPGAVDSRARRPEQAPGCGAALRARRGRARGVHLHQVKRSPRFEEASREYLAWTEANTRSARSVRVHLGPLLDYFRGKTLRDISAWLVERYKHERFKSPVHGRPIRPTTVNREFSCLRRCFNLQRQWGGVESNPVRGVKFFREDGRRERILSPEEIASLFAWRSCRWRRKRCCR